jgi:hypothetical protein
MAILNLNSKIYKMIKKDAGEKGISIVTQAHHYILLGKFFEQMPDSEFDTLNKLILETLSTFKTTG